MHHFFEAITNRDGKSLTGYFARVINPSTLATVPLYADNNGTPIITVSGVQDIAVTDELGNLSLYVEPGTYHLDIYQPDSVTFAYRVANIAMNSTKGDKGDQGDPGPPGGNAMDPGPFAGIASLPEGIPSEITQLFTSGSTAGRLIEDTSLTDADVAAHPLAIVKTANGRYFKRDPDAINVRQFKPVADGLADDTAAFVAALNYLDRLKTGSSAPLYVPPGKYRISNVNVKHRLHIYGDSSGFAGNPTASIFVPLGSDGFILNTYNTLNDTTVTPRDYGSDGTVIRGLDFVGPRGGSVGSQDNAAIKMRARGMVEDCTITGIAGCGIFIRATFGAGGAMEGNANCWVLRNIRSTGNSFDGIRGLGADANAGKGEGVIDCSTNGRWGINDLAFLSNRWAQFHLEFNGVGGNQNYNPIGRSSVCRWFARSYVIVPGQEALGKSTEPGTNNAVWRDIGPAVAWPYWDQLTDVIQGGAAQIGTINSLSTADGYSEPGQGPLWLGPSVVLSGGDYAGHVGGAYIRSAGLDGGGLSSDVGFYVRRYRNDGLSIRTQVGLDPETGYGFVMEGITSGGATQSFFRISTDGFDDFLGGFATRSITFTGQYTSRKYGTGVNQPNQLELKGHYFGPDGDNARYRGLIQGGSLLEATSQLAGRAVARGDKYEYRDFSAGGKMGVVVTTSGTVGSNAVLKEYGAIDA